MRSTACWASASSRASSQAKPDSLLDAEGLIDPAKCWAAMMANEKPGGHGERSVAVGVLDMAIWDAVAKAKRVPLWKLLADRYNGGQADEKAWVYAAGGYYYPGKGLEGLQDEMKHYLGLGYSCVKMKVGGVPLAEDLKRIEAVLKIVGAGERLAVDVNGKFDLTTAIEFGRAIKDFGLRWYEEPLDPLDYLAHAALATEYAPPLATGENLFSMQDARNLIRHGGLRPDRDILQYDPALSYGLVEYLRTIEMLKAHGWSPRRCVPHGGHQFALNIAVGLQCGGNEILSAGLRAVRRLRRRLRRRRRPRDDARHAGHRLRTQGRPVVGHEGDYEAERSSAYSGFSSPSFSSSDDVGLVGLEGRGEFLRRRGRTMAPSSRSFLFAASSLRPATTPSFRRAMMGLGVSGLVNTPAVVLPSNGFRPRSPMRRHVGQVRHLFEAEGREQAGACRTGCAASSW